NEETLRGVFGTVKSDVFNFCFVTSVTVRRNPDTSRHVPNPRGCPHDNHFLFSMIAEVVFIAILVSASIDARIVDSSKLTPDTLAASWSRSGRMPRAPPNLNSTSLQEALNDALSTLATDSFHVRKIAQTSLNGAKLPHVDNLHAMIRLVKHIVECALDDHQMVTIQTSEGKRLQFEGLIGLAPQWIRRAIDKDAQESVSACLAARATIF
ncbi:hypothetical protein BVRB_031300, partial [Beta vulgaris subsp. vulgaris]